MSTPYNDSVQKHLDLASVIERISLLTEGWNKGLSQPVENYTAGAIDWLAIRRSYDLLAEFTFKDMYTRGYLVFISPTLDQGVSWTLIHNTHLYHLRVLSDGGVFWRFYVSIDALRDGTIVGTALDRSRLLERLIKPLGCVDPDFDTVPSILSKSDYELFDEMELGSKILSRISLTILDV